MFMIVLQIARSYT